MSPVDHPLEAFVRRVGMFFLVWEDGETLHTTTYVAVGYGTGDGSGEGDGDGGYSDPVVFDDERMMYVADPTEAWIHGFWTDPEFNAEIRRRRLPP